MKQKKEYALYKGETLLSIGTVEEIAEDMNASHLTVRHYKTPAYKLRLKNRKSGALNVRELVELD